MTASPEEIQAHPPSALADKNPEPLPGATIPRMKLPALVCLSATLLLAQAAAPEVEITGESHHHLVLENKYVRVFDVEIPAHSETLMHWHRHDYIYVTIGDTEIVNTVKDKPPITVKFQDGQTGFSSASFAHLVRPADDHSFHNLTIEILDDANLRNSPSPWTSNKDSSKNEDRGLEVLPGGTAQILFVKDAIRVSEFELQPGAVIPMQHKGPQLLVAVTGLELRAGVTTSAAKPSHSALLQSGDTKWLPANDSSTIAATSSRAAKFVTLEFP
jgi:hypothetical protein